MKERRVTPFISPHIQEPRPTGRRELSPEMMERLRKIAEDMAESMKQSSPGGMAFYSRIGASVARRADEYASLLEYMAAITGRDKAALHEEYKALQEARPSVPPSDLMRQWKEETLSSNTGRMIK